MITIQYNNQPQSIAEGTTIDSFVQEMNLTVTNIAVALNNAVVPKNAWATTTLNEGDTVLVIKASYGG